MYVSGGVAEVKFYNRLRRGSVFVLKTDPDDPTAVLEGAEFKIYADTDMNGKFDSGNDKFFARLQADGNLYWIDELPSGGYFLQEAIAPDGYIRDTEMYYFEVDGKTEQIKNLNYYRSAVCLNQGTIDRISDGCYSAWTCDFINKGTIGRITGGYFNTNSNSAATVSQKVTEDELAFLKFNRINSLIDKFPANLEKAQADLAAVERNLEKAKLEYGKPFDKADELKAAEEELKILDAQLGSADDTKDIRGFAGQVYDLVNIVMPETLPQNRKASECINGMVDNIRAGRAEIVKKPLENISRVGNYEQRQAAKKLISAYELKAQIWTAPTKSPQSSAPTPTKQYALER